TYRGGIRACRRAADVAPRDSDPRRGLRLERARTTDIEGAPRLCGGLGDGGYRPEPDRSWRPDCGPMGGARESRACDALQGVGGTPVGAGRLPPSLSDAVARMGRRVVAPDAARA